MYSLSCHRESACGMTDTIGLMNRYSGRSVRYRGTDGRYNVRIAICVMSYIGCVMA